MAWGRSADWQRSTARALLAGLLLAAACLVGVGAHAQVPGLGGKPASESAAQQKPAPADPYNRTSPRALASGLVAAFAAGDYERAANYLEGADPAKLTAVARQLHQRLDSSGSLLAFAKLSNEPAGAIDDGLPPDEERIGSIKTPAGEQPLIAKNIAAADAPARWVVSAQSLRQIAKLAPQPVKPVLADALPEALNDTRVAGASIADWLVSGGLAIAAFVAMRLLFALIERLLVLAIGGDPKKNRALRFAHAAFPPLSLFLAVTAFFLITQQVQVAIVARQTLARYAGIVGWIAVVWFLWRLIDMLSDLWAERMAKSNRRRAMSALVFGRRSAKTALVIAALVGILDTLGVDVSTGIAALGIGGIALALGAQKTIENLVGSVSVIADQPVRVGDFCRVGDVWGTVEDIGMRSTRIRTNERTVVTIPNGAFSSQQIENYSRRDRFLFNPTIRLTYDTDARLMRAVVAGISSILDEDDNVIDGARVRFVAFGVQSLEIEIFAYIRTFDYAISLEMREQVLLKIMDRIAELGARLALPTQTLQLRRMS